MLQHEVTVTAFLTSTISGEHAGDLLQVGSAKQLTRWLQFLPVDTHLRGMQ